MECDSVISQESPSVKRLSESSQPRFSKLSFQSKTSNSHKRDSSIIHVDTRAHIDDAGKASTGDITPGGRHNQWRQALRKKLDGVSFTLASIIFTLMVCINENFQHERPYRTMWLYM